MIFIRWWNLTFRPLDAEIQHFRPQIRILREKSSLEPAGKLPNPESTPKYDQNYVFNHCFINHIMGLQEIPEIPRNVLEFPRNFLGVPGGF